MRLRAVLANVLRACGVMRPGPFNRVLGPLCVKAGLIACSLQFTDAVLQHGVGQIYDAILDGIVEPLEFGVRLGRPLA